MLSSVLRKFTYRNLGGIFSFRNYFTMAGESDILNSEELFDEYITNGDVISQDEAATKYLKNIKYSPISDFQKGLEWFNVTEPLFLMKHLKGKLVLLDFFTYCCINCMHILPDLKEIENEFSVEDGFVVVGVHSAKFENEKLSKNILAAVQRYNILHPVVNDNCNSMWKNCGICCWPTLLLLGPNANPIILLMGEGHKEKLILLIRNALAYYKNKNEISNHKLPLKSAYHLLPELKGPLLFPGKIVSYFDNETQSEMLAISDTGNNRILILESNGNVTHQIGSSDVGLKDGNLQEAQFNAPQGLAFQNSYTLFVADTENHAIRKINLKDKSVTTVAGIGEQGNDYKGGKYGIQQEISSPWDVCLFKTSDFNSKENKLKDVLIIAMAGTHQIWALFLEDIIWWKNQSFTSGTCICIAGSGREENRNNQYPHAAGFAQPSGLALFEKNKDVFIADSESSSIRKLSLIDGRVSAVVGGDVNPKNLFAFGDKDGKQYDAKLQHVLGLAMSKSKNILFVADTYNHKIKKINVLDNNISTINIPAYKFNEPTGLCVSHDDKKLYIADTNNHIVKVLNFGDNYNVTNIVNLDLKFPAKRYALRIDKSNCDVVIAKPIIFNSKGGKLILKVELDLIDLKLASETPQSWVVDLPSASWSCIPNSGSNVVNIDTVFSVPPSETKNTLLDFVYNLMTCKEDICIPKKFVIQQPIDYLADVPNVLEHVIKVSLNPFKLTIQF